MNLFLLDNDIDTCARYYCDQHVVKIILDSVQMLCTALNRMEIKTLYRSTHKNHPCMLWLGESYDNFLLLKNPTSPLNAEYRYRFQKQTNHRSIEVLELLSGYRYARQGLTPFAQAMPDEYTEPGDPVTAYRQLYIGGNLNFARWTRRVKPEWNLEETLETV